jgi:hypothetical protein
MLTVSIAMGCTKPKMFCPKHKAVLRTALSRWHNPAHSKPENAHVAFAFFTFVRGFFDGAGRRKKSAE